MRRLALTIAVISWLSGASTAALQAPVAFEVASVKPNTGSDLSIPFANPPPDGITLINNPLESIVRYAYQVQPFRMVGLPAWANEERFDISARASRPINDSERRQMMRSLLVERFGLKARFESREQQVYVMSRARADDKLGPGLRPRPDCTQGGACSSGGGANRVGGVANIRAITLDQFASGMMSLILGGVVRNESGIDGVFDVELSWRPDAASSDPNDSRPALFTAVEEQLGLKLTAQRRPVDVLVIDSIARPTPD